MFKSTKILSSLGIIAILALISVSCNCDKKPGGTTAAATATTAAAATAGAIKGSYDSIKKSFVYQVGDMIDFTLPDGTVVKFAQGSTEAELFNFLNNKDSKVSDDKTQGWVPLTGTEFASGSATPTDASKAQIQNLALLLKQFPNSTVKIGGYTDNTGNAEANKKLSQQRADAVKAIIVADGIAGDRVTAEGYGQEHPICPANDTDACKAQNRRVDVRIMTK